MTKFVNKQEKKQHVLDAALSLFTEKGYNAVTTREIAEKAGISKGGLYDYFENKEVLFEEVVINKMKNVLVDFKRQLLEKTDDPFERFQKIRDLSCTAHKPNKQRFFLLFDFYPAKMLMGDTGSIFLGFTLATLAIFSGGKVATAFLIMGIPILDAAWVILRRLKNKQSPFKGDLNHIHHRLLDIGISPRKALICMYTLCAVFGVSALFLDTKGKLIEIIILGITMIVMGRYLVKKQKAT